MFTSSTRAFGKTFRWILMLPVLMVGSLLYWSVAIGLGGLSLMAANALSVTTNTVALPGDTETGSVLDVGDGTTLAGPIMVHLEESVEPEDVNDNAGSAGFTAPAEDQQNDQQNDQQVTVTPGPGATSY